MRLERPTELKSTTYKYKMPETKENAYITISDILNKEGKLQTCEIFCNTKCIQTAGTISTLTTFITSVLRLNGDISKVILDLKAIYDPAFPAHFYEKTFIKSTAGILGHFLQKHLNQLNLLNE